MDRHTELLQRMREAVNLKDVLALVPQIDRLEEEMDVASAPIDFKGKGQDQ